MRHVQLHQLTIGQGYIDVARSAQHYQQSPWVCALLPYLCLCGVMPSDLLRVEVLVEHLSRSVLWGRLGVDEDTWDDRDAESPADGQQAANIVG